MTDLDIPALKAAALAATPGQWARNVAGIEHDNYIAGTGPWYRLHKGGADMASADAAYIALANPATILALIERLERAEAVAEYARSREMPTTEKQVKAAEMFFTAPMMARLEKLEDLAKAARDLGLETVCIADPPCFNCRACRFHLALAVLEAP